METLFTTETQTGIAVSAVSNRGLQAANGIDGFVGLAKVKKICSAFAAGIHGKPRCCSSAGVGLRKIPACRERSQRAD